MSLVGFAGADRAAESSDDLGFGQTRTMRGLGLRYYVANKLGTHVGFDLAEGPEDTHWYLAVDSIWN